MKRDLDGLYLLRDGTQADPADCSSGKDGVLRHTNGVAVALKDDGEPITIAANAVRSGSGAAAEAGRPKDDLVGEERDVAEKTTEAAGDKPAADPRESDKDAAGSKAAAAAAKKPRGSKAD
jgi:hypothetical protein